MVRDTRPMGPVINGYSEVKIWIKDQSSAIQSFNNPVIQHYPNSI